MKYKVINNFQYCVKTKAGEEWLQVLNEGETVTAIGVSWDQLWVIGLNKKPVNIPIASVPYVLREIPEANA